MKRIGLSFLVFISAFSAFGAKPGDSRAIQQCLDHWGKHPFGKGAPSFRTLSGKVKVLGIGGTDINDEKVTEKPELVLIKPNITVLAKTEMNLRNPNGWYCLKGKVAVLGKTVVNLDCSANLASSNDGTTVMGGSDNEGGVTVLGSSRLNRIGCKNHKIR